MNKLFMAIAVGGLAIAGHAATLDWRYTGVETDVGKTVYVLLGAEAQQQWENADALSAAAVSSGAVAKSGRSNYWATGKFENDAVTKTSADVYYVIVDADGKAFSVTSVSDMTGSVYDPANQESSPGQNTSLGSGNITKSGIAWGTGGGDDPGPGPDDPPGPGPDNPPTPGPGGDGDVPEPTSGLLLMIGGAALALRRRR